MFYTIWNFHLLFSLTPLIILHFRLPNILILFFFFFFYILRIIKVVYACTELDLQDLWIKPTLRSVALPAPSLRPEISGQPHLSAVRVRLLRVDASVLLHVAEGIGHVSAAATVVLLDTVHQVLGTKVQKFLGCLRQLALQGAGWAEGPAGTTGALRAERNQREEWWIFAYVH